MRYAALFVLGVLVLPTVTEAQERRLVPLGVGRRMALVIGNNEYSWSPLRNSVNDAEALARLLPKVGFAVADVTLVRNTKLRELQRAIREFVERLQPEDVALVYYSGHGIELHGENYLIPIDFPSNASELEVQDDAYSAQQLLRNIEATRSKVRLVILDACRDNPLRSSRSAGQGLARMEAQGQGTLIVFATGAGQTADDNPGANNGLFTSYLLQALPTPGLSVDQLVKQVARDVYRASGQRQMPAIYGMLLEDFTFVPSLRTAPTPELAREAWEKVKGTGNRALLNAYLREFGDSEYAKSARVELAALPLIQPKAPKPEGEVTGTGSVIDLGAELAQANKLYEAKNETAALPLFFHAAQMGNIDAMNIVGEIFESGHGPTLDLPEAMRWYSKAADAGSARGMYNIGKLYWGGRGVPKDESAAVKWFARAADAGDPAAATDLKRLGAPYYFEFRISISKVPLKVADVAVRLVHSNPAKNLYTIEVLADERMTEKKDKKAGEPVQFYVSTARQPYEIVVTEVEKDQIAGHLVLPTSGGTRRAEPSEQPRETQGPKGSFDPVALVAHGKDREKVKDYLSAFSLFRQAAEFGNADAMNRVGVMFEKGVGTQRDAVEALRWYRKAAESGDGMTAQNGLGMYNVGSVYENGKGTSQDYQEALNWYRRAAAVGDCRSMSKIGWFYLNGLGVTQDYAAAMNWYRKAAERVTDLGDAVAFNQIGWMYESGLGVVPNYAEAMVWYRKAADRGFVTSMRHVGLLFEKGLGMPADYSEAAKWLRKAADAGDSAAINEMGTIFEQGLGVARDRDAAISWYRKAAATGSADARINLQRLGAPDN